MKYTLASGWVMMVVVAALALGGCGEPRGLTRWNAETCAISCSGFHSHYRMGTLEVVFTYQPTNGGMSGGVGEGTGCGGGSDDPASSHQVNTKDGITTLEMLGQIVKTRDDSVWVNGQRFDFGPGQRAATIVVRRDGRGVLVTEANRSEIAEIEPKTFTYARFLELRPRIVTGSLSEEASKRLWVRLLAERSIGDQVYTAGDDHREFLRNPENFRRLMEDYVATHHYLVRDALRIGLGMSDEQIRAEAVAVRGRQKPAGT